MRTRKFAFEIYWPLVEEYWHQPSKGFFLLRTCSLKRKLIGFGAKMSYSSDTDCVLLRAVGRSENPAGVGGKLQYDGHNLLPMEIVLLYYPPPPSFLEGEGERKGNAKLPRPRFPTALLLLQCLEISIIFIFFADPKLTLRRNWIRSWRRSHTKTFWTKLNSFIELSFQIFNI